MKHRLVLERWILLLGACLLAHAGLAQNFPGIQYSAPVELAQGVVFYSGVSTSPRWQVRVIEVDMTEKNVNLVPVRALPGVLERTSTLAARAHAVAAVNGGYFGANPAQSYSHLQIDGVVRDRTVASRPARSVFGVSANHQEAMAITRLNSLGEEVAPFHPQWHRVIDAIGAGPRLMSNGAVDVRHVEEEFDAASGIDATGRQPRTAIGFNATTARAWLVTVDGRQSTWSVGMTLDELARLLQDLGAREAMNFDGGGSTTCWTSTAGVANRPSDAGNTERSVINALAVVPSFVIDNTDMEFSRTGTWSTSANAGFYNTNSLFAATGTAQHTATWRPGLARAGLYEVSAWWVASGNRSATADFVVHHRNGSTAAPMNQKLDGSRWNVLGRFEFDPGTAGHVTLTSTGASGEFVSADAVKFVLIEPRTPTPPTREGWVVR